MTNLTTNQIARLFRTWIADRVRTTEQRMDDAYSDLEPTPPDPLETPAWAGWLAWAGLIGVCVGIGFVIGWMG